MIVLIRSTWIIVFTLLCTALASLVALPFALLGAGAVVYRLGRVWAALVLAVAGIRVQVENRSALMYGRPVLYLANHQSFLDVVAFFTVLRSPVAYMAKASLFRVPVFGRAMRGIGCIPVERGDAKRSMQSLLDAADLVRAGRALLIFPEGSRSPDATQLLHFKKGAFVLAKKAGVAVQPLTISGSNRLLPHQPGRWMPRIYRGTIRVVVHPAIPVIDHDGLSAEELLTRVNKKIAGPLERLKVFADILG